VAPPAPTNAKPGTFDPELGGNLIAERARVCFDAGQVSAGLHFGFSALYGTDGRVKRVFLPARAELMEDEEVCLIRQASGVFAGGAPKQQTTVGYAVRLGKARTDVRIRSIR
jgi:hypothetical protein